MKAQGGKFPALEGKEILYNKTVHSWKYSNNHALTSDEFYDCLKTIKKEEVIPFVILDVRNAYERENYELPKRNRVQILVLKI